MGRMDSELQDNDFAGCHRECRTRGEHSRVWGGCEFGIRPEPTVSMSKVYPDSDGHNSSGFDVYTASQLAEDVIEPALRGIRMLLGPEMTEAVLRGESILPFGEEGSGIEVAGWIARAIIQRNDPPELIPIPGIPTHGVDCPCPKGET